MRIPGNACNKTVAQPVPTLAECLAKTRDVEGVDQPGRTVEAHCRVAAAVAARLTELYGEVYPHCLPLGAEVPALVHDIGKICPTFAAKIYDAILGEEGRRSLSWLATADPSLERQWGGHAAVTYAALLACGAPEAMARIAGGHHGRAFKTDYTATCDAYGGGSWQALRHSLLRKLLGDSPTWPDFTGKPHLERLITGMTIVADWIASGSLFDNPNEDWQPLVAQAVEAAGYTWPTLIPGLRFADVFSFEPRPAQRALYEAVTAPGVYILEAPMGLGKTEAALYAAYGLLERKQATGVYFALPTRLTSNRIHTRMNAFLQRIFTQPPRAHLLHGMAWLEHFAQQELGMEGSPNGSWFARGKRGILAPFGVGTIDQALLSVMHVRHGALRTFGLAGKVVILDEVHSYDAYTGTLLDKLVDQLQNIGCTVIILSATLTEARRRELGDTHSADNAAAYPRISAVPATVGGGTVTGQVLACDPPQAVTVWLWHPVNDGDALEEALLRAEQGQRVLWIENTVGEAQALFQQLAARAAAMDDLPVGLLHSRFIPAHRERREEEWTAAYAAHAPERGTQGRILVGTQVVEQSLDIDADFLVSRFCPTDMLLQRLGRLWRHADTPRPPAARREAWLLHPPLEDALVKPQQSFGGSGWVYAPYVLCRSLELWQAREALSLPADIRPLLEATYAPREETVETMAAAMRELERERRDLRTFALQGVSTAAAPADDDNPPTRWGTQKAECEVLLLRAWDARHKRLELASGETVVLQDTPDLPGDCRAGWRRRSAVAAQLARNVVRVEASRAPESPAPKAFKPWIYCDTLRVALVEPSGNVTGLNGVQPVRAARYDEKLGYQG